MDIMFLLTYLIYCLAIVGVISLVVVLYFKLEKTRVGIGLIKDLIEKGYETEHIDIDKFLNNK